MLLLEAFGRIAAATPERPLYTFWDVNGRVQATLTFGEAWAQSAAVAGYLHKRAGLKPGDRAVLVYPPSLAFITGFVGCLMAGVVPVPMYPPHPFKLHHDLNGFAALVADSGARAILTSLEYNVLRQAGGVKDMLLRTGARWPELPWLVTDKFGAASAPGHQPAPDDVAFLQYTSGSTSMPKGVMITHGNIAAEVAFNAEAIGLGPDTRAVIWVPQYHDLGLISCILSALWGNGHLHMISPLSFLQRPAVWMEVMHQVRATHTCTPNFGLSLAVSKTTPAQRAAWDLSSLGVIICGAEPIREESVEGFFAAYAGSGLRRETFLPAYGLAEHTVGVCCGGHGMVRFDRGELAAGRARVAEGAEGLALYAVGHVTKADCRVRIVDSEACTPVADGVVGEVWVDSPTKAAGYHGRPEESEAAFGGTLAEPDGRRYLRTGDLGFFLDGELYIAGRQKDLVIVRGRNHYPHDLEASAQKAHPLVRLGGVAAFGLDDAEAGEGVGIVLELVDELGTPAIAREVAEAVRDAVRRDHQVPVHAVAVGVLGTLLRTTSGKVRRRANREALLDGRHDGACLHVGRYDAPSPALADWSPA